MSEVPRQLARCAVAVAVVATLALGLQLRLDDPLANPVIPAEDPYTHMLLVREHLRDGNIDPQFRSGSLYPPGLHSLVATWDSFTGAELYDLVRFGPVLFGVLGLVGIVVLLGPREGAAAAFVAILAAAIMPELVVRTTMLAPSAVDLALVPFYLAALLEVARGRLGWAVPLALMTGFLVLAHPWVVAVLALAAFAFVGFGLAFPWARARGPPMARAGVGTVFLVLGGGLALAAATRWDQSDSGFADLVAPLVARVGVAGMVLAALGAVVVVALALLAPRLPARLRPPETAFIGMRLGGVALLGAFVALLVVGAAEAGMPKWVDLPDKVGWPILILAALGLLIVPAWGSPATHLAGAVFATTLPFVLHDLLNNPLWPHRAIAYMGLGAALLAGIAVARAAEGASRLGAALAAAWARRAPARASAVRATAVAALVPALLVASGAGVALLNDTPPPDRWYRIFNPCELDALRGIGASAAGDPKALYLVDHWKTQLTTSSFSTINTRFWIAKDFYDPEGWDPYVRKAWLHKKPTFVIVDRHLPKGADVGFLDQPPWVKLEEHCVDQARRPLQLYALDGEAYATWREQQEAAAAAPANVTAPPPL